MNIGRNFLRRPAALAALLGAVACGGGGTQAPAPTATPVVIGGAPTAPGLSLQTQEDVPLSGQLPLPAGLSAGAVTYELAQRPARGDLELLADGRYRYWPYGDFSGIDGFAYRVVDSRGVHSSFTVEVTVLAVNDAPRLAGVPLAATLGEGVAQIPVGAADAGLGAVAIQADGRILLTALGDAYPVVERLAADGTPQASLRVGLGNVYDVAVTADGKFVVAGARSWDFAVARVNADGTPDGSFGEAGGVAVALPSSTPTESTQVMPLADGSVLAGGYRYRSGGGVDTELVRFTRDGRWDMAFGGGRGSVVFSGSVAAQADGRILVASPAAGASGARLSRYLADGITPDAGFGGNGTVGTAFDGRATVQPDGRILLAGVDATGELKLQRFGIDGTVDVQFGAGSGLVTLAANAQAESKPRVVVQTDGRILVGLVIRSGADAGSGDAQALLRFDADGTGDLSFGGNGVALLPFGTADDVWSSSTPIFGVQPDGRIVVAGVGWPFVGGITPALLARLLPDGRPDLDFGTRKPLQAGSPFARTMPAGTFVDPDGDAMTYSATLQDGSALPSWLHFDAAAGTFSGTPPVGTTSLFIKVRASDPGGLSGSSVFGVRVLDAPVIEKL